MIWQTGIRLLLWLAVALAAFPLHALDRNAFTFTRYSLKANIRPAEHEFQASGTIELRNDSNSPQKEVPLQISSSLAWKEIRLEGHQPVAYIKQSYTSDIDHTGALEEAIVTLPEALAPGATLKLEVSYGGEIRRSSGRLTRIGAPESIISRRAIGTRSASASAPYADSATSPGIRFPSRRSASATAPRFLTRLPAGSSATSRLRFTWRCR